MSFFIAFDVALDNTDLPNKNNSFKKIVATSMGSEKHFCPS